MTDAAQIERACPVCQSDDWQPHWRKGDLSIVRCKACGMVYINPVLAAMASGQFYDTEGADYYLSPAKLASDYADVRFERELRLLRQFCPRGSVLDVGCGSGGFLFQLKKRWPNDYEILGTDVSGGPLDYAESKGVPVVRGDFLEQQFGQSPGAPVSDPARSRDQIHLAESETGAPFDVVTLWAVAEHLAEPKRFLEKARALLKPGGVCFVLVPNLRSLAVRLLGAKYRYVYAQHLNYFSAVTLGRLGERAGFEVVATRFMHFNPVVFWQDWRGGGRDVSNTERGELLKQTTAMKQKPWIKPVKALYSLTEQVLSTMGLADNVVVIFRKGVNHEIHKTHESLNAH
jgi:2-polyprenyl-3-methyl-5-hydroxy-6-metoxy-1,4-benzoquinol methylase